MKSYPSIPNCGGTSHRDISGAYVFDKIDGNNLRFEWNRKQGWYKFGSRNGLIDKSNEQFAGAIPWFLENMADHIHSAFKKHPTHIVAFAEWAGPNSFAGMHEPGDNMSLPKNYIDKFYKLKHES